MKAWENQIIQCEHTITLQQVENAPKLEKKGMLPINPRMLPLIFFHSSCALR